MIFPSRVPNFFQHFFPGIRTMIFPTIIYDMISGILIKNFKIVDYFHLYA